MSKKKELPLNDKIISIILAGGLGTRLHPLTLHRCKPGVSFGGRYRLIDIPISNSLNSQIPNIFVISQYFASMLQQHLSATYAHDSLKERNLQILCPEETPDGIHRFEGTADAVRKNLRHLTTPDAEYYLILSGDQLYNIDLLELIKFTKECNADLVIASLVVKENEAKRMGLLQLDPRNKVIDFYEKPKEEQLLKKFRIDEQNPRYLGSMGIYVFKKEALIHILQEPGDDFGKDIIPLMVKKGNTYGFTYDGYWEDIGTIASYYEANLALIQGKNCLNTDDPHRPIYTKPEHLPSSVIKETRVHNSLISQGCFIEAQEISNSLIGLCSKIDKGSIIRDSIVIGSPGSRLPIIPLRHVGENCLIQKAILDEQSQIGNNVILTNEKNLIHYDGDGIFIRDGIIIVTSGTKVPDGFIL